MTNQELEIEITSMLEGGQTLEAIQNYFINERKLKEDKILKIIDQCQKTLEEEYKEIIDSTLGIHLERYDNEINELLLTDFDSLREEEVDEGTIRRLKLASYFSILDIMKRKERLLGFHQKNFTLRLIQRTNNFIKPSLELSHWNISVLTGDEKLELLSLIQKCKKNNNMLEGVILKGEKNDDEKIEDVEYKEVEHNIDQMKEIKQVEPDKVKTLMDLKTKIRIALERKAKDEFRKKGAKVDY